MYYLYRYNVLPVGGLKDIQYDRHIFLISGFVYITFLYFDIPIIDMRTNLTVHVFYCLWLPFSVSGCLFFNNIVHHISVRFIESEYNLFTCVGTNSMTYYVWHWIFLLPANYLLINIIHVPKEYCLPVSYTHLTLPTNREV